MFKHKSGPSLYNSQKLMVNENENRFLRLQVVINKKGLLELNLADHGLMHIPEEVFSMNRLEVLKLTRNVLRHLPPVLSSLRRLKILTVKENNLSTIPDTLANCTHLKELDVSKNRLSFLPRTIESFQSLQVLKLGENEFECIPHELGLLPSLAFLDLHGNRLWYLPFTIQKLKKLKHLDLSQNLFEHAPMPVCKLSSLTVLNLRDNRLISLSPNFDELKNLQDLDLSFNSLTSFSNVICKLANIQSLNIAHNKVQSIPSQLSNMSQLKTLNIQSNCLEYLPESCPRLQYLNVSHNNLTNFSVLHMKKLKSMNASHNHLENIPMGTFLLHNLELINLSSNKIKFISDDICQMIKLKSLDLSNNRILTIPETLNHLPSLDYFNITGNSLKNGYNSTNSHSRSTGVKRKYKTESKTSAKGEKIFDKKHEIETKENTMSRKHDTSKKSIKQAFTPSTMRRFLQPQEKIHYKSMEALGHKTTTQTKNMFYDKDKDATLKSSKFVPQWIYESSKQNQNEFSWASDEGHMTINDDDESYRTVRTNATDYNLLGVCSQLETMLGQQESINDNEMEAEFMKDSKQGIFDETADTFTITPSGGEYASTIDVNLRISIPANSVTGIVKMFVKIIKIEQTEIERAITHDRMVDNILSTGPVVYMASERDITFTKAINMTVSTPESRRRGYLHLLTVMEDHTCLPSSIKYTRKHGYLSIKAWSLSGKVVALMKTKCKYKASKSMEQLLQYIHYKNEKVESTQL